MQGLLNSSNIYRGRPDTKISGPKGNRGKSVSIKGKTYTDVPTAARLLEISQTQIYNKLKSSRFPSWFYTDSKGNTDEGIIK